MACRTSARLIGAILAVAFAITLPEPRNAFLIGAAAAMLSRRAIRYASLTVACHIELIGAGALVARTVLTVNVDV